MFHVGINISFVLESLYWLEISSFFGLLPHSYRIRLYGGYVFRSYHALHEMKRQ